MDKQVNQKTVKSGGSIFQRLTCKQAAEDSFSNDDKVPCNTTRMSTEARADASFQGTISSDTGNGDAFMSSGEFVRNHGSLLSLQPWIFRKGDYRRDKEIVKVNGDFSDKCVYEINGFVDNSLAEISPQSVNLSYARGGGRSTLRTRRSRHNSIKPLSSLENCLIPQLYNENFEFEEFVFSSLPSTTAPSLRPFVVTDGSKIISKSTYGHRDVNYESEIDKGNMKNVTGVSPLPDLRTPKRKSWETPREKLGSSKTQRACELSHHKDSFDGIHIFSFGVSLGVISAMLSNRKKIENLNDMLKSSENLVQDLQEELEMKDSITVKELANEACGHQKPSDSIADLESIECAENQVPTSYLSAEQNNENNELNLPKEDSRSKIEAELEIELEQLELSMSTSSLNGRMSALGELDPELVVDVVHGELKADMLPGRVSDEQTDNASDSMSTSTNHMHNANYAVSPQELSLRLHEVIQSRLEERVKELERTLKQTQEQLQSESERLLSQRTFSSSDMGSSSNQDSPMCIPGGTAPVQPFCLNLAGDALDACDEACEEFMWVANTEENLPSTTDPNDEAGYCLHSCDQSLVWGLEGPKEQDSKNRGLKDDHETHAMKEDEYYDDEMKMLIEQILERTRQGSPVVLHAKRLLSSMDE